MRARYLLVLAGCSTPSPPPVVAPPPSPPAVAALASGSVLATLVPDDATSVTEWRPRDLPFLSILDEPPEMYRCWRELEQSIDVAYQVGTADKSSIVILAGSLPRAQVQSCVDDALLYSRTLKDETRDEGGQLVAETAFGVVHAGWRDGYVVLGRAADVTRSLAAQTPSPHWAAELAQLPSKQALATTSMAAVSHDRTMAGLIGVPTTSWTITLDVPEREWPAKNFFEHGDDPLDRFAKDQETRLQRKQQGLPPLPTDAAPAPDPAALAHTMRGRVTITYGSPADAQRAADIVAKHAFAFELEENLALALSKLPQKVSGATLALEFTMDSFAGVDLEKLQAWFARVQATANAKH